MAPWVDGPGVIALPDGTRVRGRGLRRPAPSGQLPTFGLYLLGHEPPAMAWETRWLEWPDFRVPRDREHAIRELTNAYERAAVGRVEIVCDGGRGRTGTALACIAVLAGVPSEQAVDFVRSEYDRGAVETPFQRRFVGRFGR